MSTVNPYLTFDGNCREAAEFYRSVFGGEFAMISTFSDGPPDMPVAEEDKDRIMHVSLPLGDGQVLMASDQPSDRDPVQAGSSISISFGPESAAEGRRVFEALADGGMVVMPYEKQFWNADYGMCVDRYGISWMVNYEYPEEG